MRHEACFDVIQDVFRRWYGIELPDDPGMAINSSGHRQEAAKI
jgi:hypothetical protein